MAKYIIGDQLKIVKRMYGHGFDIGNIVTVKYDKFHHPFDVPLFFVESNMNGYWVCEEEVDPIFIRAFKLKII